MFGWIGAGPRVGGASILLAVLTLAPSFADAQLRLPEPTAPPQVVIEEQGESPLYYRLPDDSALFTGRTALGATWRSDDDGTGIPGWGFSLDVALGGEFGFGRGSRAAWALEGGYSYVYEGEHLFSAGTGIVIRRFGPAVLDRQGTERPSGDLVVNLVPHFVVGTVRGELALGVRAGLLFAFWMYGVLVSYQFARVGDDDMHEAQLAFCVYWRLE